MDIEKFFSFKGGEEKVYNISRGKYTGLLFSINTEDVAMKNYLNQITIRVILRTSKAKYVICNNEPLSLLANYASLSGGVDHIRGTQQIMYSIVNQLRQFNYAYDKLESEVGNAVTNPVQKGNLAQIDEHFHMINACGAGFYFNFGHITLVDSELEITLNNKNEDFEGVVYGVHAARTSDHLRIWDKTVDFLTTQHRVLEILDVSSLSQKFKQDSGYWILNNVEYQLDFDRGASKLFDIKGAIAANQQMSQEFPEVEVLSLFRSDSPIGETVRFKVDGYMNCRTVFIKSVIPETVHYATVEMLEDQKAAIERLSDDEQRRARHANLVDGKIDELTAMIETVKESNKAKGLDKK